MNLELVRATAYFTCGALMLFLGFVIVRENPRQRVNRAVGAMLLFGGLGPILGAYYDLSAGAALGGPGVSQDVFARFAFLWEFFFPATLLFALVFPRLHPWLRRWRWLGWLLFVPHVAHVALIWIAGNTPELVWPAWFEAQSGLFGSLLSLTQLLVDYLLDAHVRFFSFVNFAMAVASVVLLMRSARSTTNPKLRSQVRTIQRGLTFSLTFYSAGELLPTVFGISLERSYVPPLITFSLLVGAVSIVVAIVRLGFLDVRYIVRHGLVYGLTSGVIVAIYLFIGKQFDRFSAQLVGRQIPVFETTFLVLSLFLLQPVLSGIERLVDRGQSRDRTDLRNAFDRLSGDVAQRIDPDDIAALVAEAVRREMVLHSAAVVLRDRGGLTFTHHRSDDYDGGPASWRHGEILFAAMEGIREPIRARELAELPERSEDKDALATALGQHGVETAIALRATADGEASAQDAELVGVLLLGEKVTETRIPFDEMSTLLLFTRQLGLSLQNAALQEERIATRLLQEEVATARQIQEQLLPEGVPELAGWDVEATNEPSRHIGGDYHDFVALPKGEWGIAIGDVSGKGVPAALLMSNLQASLRGRLYGDDPIENVVADVNRAICRSTGAESFISFFLAELCPRSGAMRYTNAGHNAPVLIRRDGRVELLEQGGLLLGVFPEAEYERGAAVLEPGDLLALYTDGVTEATNPDGEMYTEERLTEALARHREEGAEALHRRILNDVETFQAGLPPDDDLTLILLKRAEASHGNGAAPGLEVAT